MMQPEKNVISNNEDDDSAVFRDAWKDFEVHRAVEQKKYNASHPHKIGNVLARLVSRRGYAQICTLDAQEKAWQKVVGTELASVTQFAKLSRGTLHIVAANSLLIQELMYRKEELLASLQRALPEAGVKQLRFKVGKIKLPPA